MSKKMNDDDDDDSWKHDLFAVLGVPRSADAAALRRAYLRAALVRPSTLHTHTHTHSDGISI